MGSYPVQSTNDVRTSTLAHVHGPSPAQRPLVSGDAIFPPAQGPLVQLAERRLVTAQLLRRTAPPIPNEATGAYARESQDTLSAAALRNEAAVQTYAEEALACAERRHTTLRDELTEARERNLQMASIMTKMHDEHRQSFEDQQKFHKESVAKLLQEAKESMDKEITHALEDQRFSNMENKEI